MKFDLKANNAKTTIAPGLRNVIVKKFEDGKSLSNEPQLRIYFETEDGKSTWLWKLNMNFKVKTGKTKASGEYSLDKISHLCTQIANGIPGLSADEVVALVNGASTSEDGTQYLNENFTNKLVWVRFSGEETANGYTNTTINLPPFAESYNPNNSPNMTFDPSKHIKKFQQALDPVVPVGAGNDLPF